VPVQNVSFCAVSNADRPTKSVAMKIGPTVFVFFLCFSSPGSAEGVDQLDELSSITREQWKERVDASKARIREMRREGKSLIPTPEEDLLRRLLDDSTLVYGDIVATEHGVFQFVGKSDGPHSPEDFRQVARDRAYPRP
jgi:hypothetical protein